MCLTLCALVCAHTRALRCFLCIVGCRMCATALQDLCPLLSVLMRAEILQILLQFHYRASVQFHASRFHILTAEYFMCLFLFTCRMMQN